VKDEMEEREGIGEVKVRSSRGGVCMTIEVF